MHRFFIAPDLIAKSSYGLLALEGPVAHQIIDVLRLRIGAEVCLLDNAGSEYPARIERIERKLVVVRLMEQRVINTEPTTHITIYQSLLKGDKYDWVLQKCTEIGVCAFVPVISERCVARANEGRQERDLRIIQEAAEQSHRGTIPSLYEPISFAAACQQAPLSHERSLILWEQERGPDLRQALSPTATSVAIFVGPEGGYSPQEVTLAQEFGIIAVTLGPRILRAETAGLVAAAITLFSYGEMNFAPTPLQAAHK